MSYSFTTDIAVRYADVDTYGHVNNAVYATLCEEARIDYLEHVLGDAGASIGGDRTRLAGDGENGRGHGGDGENGRGHGWDGGNGHGVDDGDGQAGDDGDRRARDDGNGDGVGDEADSMGVVVANLQLDFERPLGRADAVEVGVRVPRLGGKSFPFEYEVRTPAGVHAVGETTMVAYDRTTREARRIPDRWRTSIAEFEGIRPPGDASR